MHTYSFVVGYQWISGLDDGCAVRTAGQPDNVKAKRKIVNVAKEARGSAA